MVFAPRAILLRLWAYPMNLAHFVRIEREGPDGASTHYVVHTHDPTFSLQLAPDVDAPNKLGKGVIRRLHVPNSWAGDYNRYGAWIAEAQEFFHRSFAEPVAKAETRRLQH
jgi:hypothetical protein